MPIVKKVSSLPGSFLVIPIVAMLVSTNFFSLCEQQAKAQTLTNNGALTSNATKVFSYKYGHYNITMNYPANWVLNTTGASSLLKSIRQNPSLSQNVSSTLSTLHFLAFFFPGKEGVGNKSVAPTVLTLAIKDNVGNVPLDKYINDILNQQTINKTAQLSKNSTTLGGLKGAIELVYSKKDNQDRLTKNMNIVATRDNIHTILFLFSTSPKSYGKYLPEIDIMKNSFVIK
jgi:hypothetical protein